MKSNNTVVELFPDQCIPFPSGDVVRYVGLDYDRLAAAIIEQQEKEKKQKAEAAKAASARRRHTTAANGTVDPIKDKKDIIRIAKYFYEKKQYRNELLFLIGCCVGLRGSDLVELRVGDILPETYQIRIKEKKTGKYRMVTLNDMAIEAYHALVQTLPDHTKDTYLFQSQRKGNQCIERHSFARILREAQTALNLPYRLGTHSMRKTFAYHVFMDNQKSPEILAYLQHLLNHHSPQTTLRYIGLDAEKMESIYRKLDFGFCLTDIEAE